MAPVFHLRGSIWAGSLPRKDAVLGCLAAATIFYCVAVFRVLRGVSVPIWWVLAVALMARVGLLGAPPFMSSDIYRYVWDGHVQAAGINPYVHVPSDAALVGLRDGAVYPNINRLDYAHTIYPPAAQLLFRAADGLGYSVLATKLVLLALEAAGIAALWRILQLAELPEDRLLIYAWNPLAIWAFAADGHVDAAAVGLLLLALLARVSGRLGLAGAALAGAFLVKFLPVVVAPALWGRRDWRLPAAFAATVLGLYGWYLGAGWRMLGFLPAYAHEEGMAQGGAGFWAVRMLGEAIALPAASGGVYFAGCALVLGGLAAWMMWRTPPAAGPEQVRRVCSQAGVLAGGTMLAMSPHYAWYFPWLAAFATVAPWRILLFLGCAPLVLYADPYHATLSIPTLVFLPALLLAARDFLKGRPVAG